MKWLSIVKRVDIRITDESSDKFKPWILVFIGFLLAGCGGDSSSAANPNPPPKPQQEMISVQVSAKTISTVDTSQNGVIGIKNLVVIEGASVSLPIPTTDTVTFSYPTLNAGDFIVVTIDSALKSDQKTCTITSPSKRCSIKLSGSDFKMKGGSTERAISTKITAVNQKGVKVSVQTPVIETTVKTARFEQMSQTNSFLALQCALSGSKLTVIPVFTTGSSVSGGFIPTDLNVGAGTCTIGTKYSSPSIKDPDQFYAGNSKMTMYHTKSRDGQFAKLTFSPTKTSYQYHNESTQNDQTVNIVWNPDQLTLNYTESASGDPPSYIQAIANAWGATDPNCETATSIAIMEACSTVIVNNVVTEVTKCDLKAVGQDTSPGLGQWQTKCPTPPGNDGYRQAFMNAPAPYGDLYSAPEGCAGSCHSVTRGTPGSTCNLFKINNAAEAARLMYKTIGNSFSPWVTFSSGAYKKARSYVKKSGVCKAGN